MVLCELPGHKLIHSVLIGYKIYQETLQTATKSLEVARGTAILFLLFLLCVSHMSVTLDSGTTCTASLRESIVITPMQTSQIGLTAFSKCAHSRPKVLLWLQHHWGASSHPVARGGELWPRIQDALPKLSHVRNEWRLIMCLK